MAAQRTRAWPLERDWGEMELYEDVEVLEANAPAFMFARMNVTSTDPVTGAVTVYPAYHHLLGIVDCLQAFDSLIDVMGREPHTRADAQIHGLSAAEIHERLSLLGRHMEFLTLNYMLARSPTRNTAAPPRPYDNYVYVWERTAWGTVTDP